MARLLQGRPLDEVVALIPDVFSWRLNGAQVAIAWVDDDGEPRLVTRVAGGAHRCRGRAGRAVGPGPS